MNNDRQRLKKVAEKVVRGMVNDIRTIDIFSYSGLTGEQANIVADLLTEAKVELKWTR